MTDYLEDYVDVAERIAAFHRRYPDGSLQPAAPWRIETIGEQHFVVYEAVAYRNPQDHRPGHGTAWEPFPGRTPFTRDSELMNAETAAWGRALVAIGIVASRKLASRQEIQARQAGDVPAGNSAGGGNGGKGPSDAQAQRIKTLVAEHHVSRLELAGILDQWGVELSEGWLERLTPGKDGTASRMIDALSRLEKPQVDA